MKITVFSESRSRIKILYLELAYITFKEKNKMMWVHIHKICNITHLRETKDIWWNEGITWIKTKKLKSDRNSRVRLQQQQQNVEDVYTRGARSRLTDRQFECEQVSSGVYIYVGRGGVGEGTNSTNLSKFAPIGRRLYWGPAAAWQGCKIGKIRERENRVPMRQ